MCRGIEFVVYKHLEEVDSLSLQSSSTPLIPPKPHPLSITQNSSSQNISILPYGFP